MPTADTNRGYTPNDLARVLKVSRDKIVGWIKRGELQAVNVAGNRLGRPRYVILPWHLTAWEKTRQAATPAPTARKRRRSEIEDFYPD